MRIQIVSRYIVLSEEGLVPKLECPLDQGLLLSNLNLEDNIVLYCLSCNYKKFVGLDLYNDLQKKVLENDM
jgi:hypothetical protein